MHSKEIRDDDPFGATGTYVKVFGVVYALVAIMGFFIGKGMLLGLISINVADTSLDVAIAVAAVIAGFGSDRGDMGSYDIAQPGTSSGPLKQRR